MKLLRIINENNFEPQDYTIRKVVRALIVDETSKKILFFGNHLIGGGVEEKETDEDALHREAMEEAGAEVEIIKSLGEVIAYGDYTKKKYIVHGYLCKLTAKLGKPTTLDPEEQKQKIQWLEIPLAINKLEDAIQLLSSQYKLISKDTSLQNQINNRKTSLIFLQEI